MLVVGALHTPAQPRFGFAVWNVDRLYDTLPSPFHNDDDFTPEGRYRWTSERYERKAAQIAAVLDSMAMPVVALAGIENEAVVRDLVARSRMDYSYIHRTIDSFDGLDFALLYFGDLLEPLHIESGRRHLTVRARIAGEEFAFIICRRAGHLAETVEELTEAVPDIRIVVAGDLRDTDFDKAGLVDATLSLEHAGRGNALFNRGWVMAERIAATPSLTVDCEVYARRWLLDRSGAPAATFDGTVYKGGAGRRLPVAATIALTNSGNPSKALSAR